MAKLKPQVCASTFLLPLFARNLRRIREREGLSQAQLAARADTAFSFVSMLENAKRAPSLETIEHLGQAMGVRDPREFFKGKLP